MMKKMTRRSKQPIDAIYADENQQDCRKRVRELEQENKAFQVCTPFHFLIIQIFRFNFFFPFLLLILCSESVWLLRVRRIRFKRSGSNSVYLDEENKCIVDVINVEIFLALRESEILITFESLRELEKEVY